MSKIVPMEYRLRAWEITDLESLVRHANNYNVAKWLTNRFPHPYTEADGRIYIDAVREDESSKVFAIEVDGEAVGSIGIIPQHDIHAKNAEIGYWLSEAYWGNGIVSGAINEVVDYAFATFDILRIFACTFHNNIASQKVLEKNGFILEARLKNAVFKNGELLDELIFSKLKE